MKARTMYDMNDAQHSASAAINSLVSTLEGANGIQVTDASEEEHDGGWVAEIDLRFVLRDLDTADESELLETLAYQLESAAKKVRKLRAINDPEVKPPTLFELACDITRAQAAAHRMGGTS